MLFYSEFCPEPRQITQRNRLNSWACLLVGALTLGLTVAGDFLITNTLSTLKIIAAVFATVNCLSWLCGWFAGINQNPSKWSHDGKFYKKVWAICRSLFIFLTGFLVAYVGFILFGVPLTSSVSETLHFALVLDVLTVVPGCLLFGSISKNWLRILLGSGPQSNWEQSWLNTVCGSLVGAWLGAFVIPLDWDRPWQVWPVSSCYGSLAGYTLSHVFNLFVLRQKTGRRKHV